MENMTAARDISAVAPINVLRGIKPLCVPYVPSSDFAEEPNAAPTPGQNRCGSALDLYTCLISRSRLP